MDIIETINTGNVISIGYNEDCEEYLFSVLDRLYNISYVDYKLQKFHRDSFIISDESYMRDTKLNLIMNTKHDKGYNIVNLNNFESEESETNKVQEIRDFIRSVSTQGYMWSTQDLKIRTIFLSQSYEGISGEMIMRGGSSLIYSSDLVLMISENEKFEIVKDTNSPCSVERNMKNYTETSKYLHDDTISDLFTVTTTTTISHKNNPKI